VRSGSKAESPGKNVLFLKKEPKNFYSLARVPGGLARVQANEVFFASFFFRKKKVLSSADGRVT
jgi:hypothetical protein